MIKVNCSISPNLYVQTNPPSWMYLKSVFLALTSSGLFFLHFQMFLKIPKSKFHGIFYGNFERFDKNVTTIC